MTTVGEIAVHLAVAGYVFDGFFCPVVFPRAVLDGICDWLGSVSQGFLPTLLYMERCLQIIR